MDSIITRIREEKEAFRNRGISIGPSYTFSQYKTIQRINLYLASQFESGEYDEDGFKKYFYNIVNAPCDVATKEIDLDTKDIIVRAENGDFIAAELMAMELKQWMKEQGFARDLNEYADLAPRYGSVVVKEVKKKLFTVDLRNFIITDQSAKSLDHTNTIELHTYTYDQMLKMPGWDKKKVKEAIDLYQKNGKTVVEVDERYGWVKESELKEDGDPLKMVYTLAIVAGSEEVERSPRKEDVIESGVVLYHKEIKAHPYLEWHWKKVPGRWLGMGYVELLFDAQMARNESKYYKRSGLRWSSLHLFQTDDQTINKNLLLDAKNGDIIKTAPNRTVSAVPVESRNLSEYSTEDQDWDRLAAVLTFTPDVISGEGLPSGTPARSAMISDSNVKKFFDRKREDFGIFVKGIITDYLIPMFKQEMKKGHIFSLKHGSQADRDRIEQMLLDAKLQGMFADHVISTGTLPSLEEWTAKVEAEQQAMSRRSTIDIEIPDAFYDTLEESIDIVITKESEDTDARIAGRQAVLSALSSNPQIAVNPETRGIFMELADAMGVKNIRVPAALPQQAITAQPAGPMAPGGAQPTMPAPALPGATSTGTAV